ncbi:MAG: rhodanese-like domain-containing protein [Deltaproteobacteria bacterium]|nr:rhodanese-like domain-containing protein [Deltaproteobacteria bacterium]
MEQRECHWGRRLAWVAGAFSAFLLSVGSAAGASRDVGAAEAATLIEARQGKADFAVLDLRTPKEFGEGRIAGAVMVDFLAPTFRQELANLDRGKTYLVYCRSGNRSRKALAVLDELGFHDVVHLSRGIAQWKEAGFPTVPGEGGR